MAKKNVRSAVKKSELSNNILLANYPSLSDKMSLSRSMHIQPDANMDPDLVPHCLSSFCYLGLIVWLLLDKNYNLLVGRSSLIVTVVCYMIEFAKFACHSYLIACTSNRTKLKTNPIVWVFQFVVFTGLTVCVAYVSSILFGAPIATKQEQTFVFSVLITAVIITPTAIQLGTNILPLLLTDCLEAEISSTVEIYLKNNFRATVLGAFIGSMVIPLDWDTDWQRWPIPCSIGLLGGHLLANVYEIIRWQLKLLNYHSIKKNKF